MVVGAIAFVVATMIDYRTLVRLAWIGLGVAIVLLLVARLLGRSATRRHGAAYRWLNLARHGHPAVGAREADGHPRARADVPGRRASRYYAARRSRCGSACSLVPIVLIAIAARPRHRRPARADRAHGRLPRDAERVADGPRHARRPARDPDPLGEDARLPEEPDPRVPRLQRRPDGKPAGTPSSRSSRSAPARSGARATSRARRTSSTSCPSTGPTSRSRCGPRSGASSARSFLLAIFGFLIVWILNVALQRARPRRRRDLRRRRGDDVLARRRQRRDGARPRAGRRRDAAVHLLRRQLARDVLHRDGPGRERLAAQARLLGCPGQQVPLAAAAPRAGAHRHQARRRRAGPTSTRCSTRCRARRRADARRARRARRSVRQAAVRAVRGRHAHPREPGPLGRGRARPAAGDAARRSCITAPSRPSLPAIRAQGLVKGQRHHVHLSADSRPRARSAAGAASRWCSRSSAARDGGAGHTFYAVGQRRVAHRHRAAASSSSSRITLAHHDLVPHGGGTVSSRAEVADREGVARGVRGRLATRTPTGERVELAARSTRRSRRHAGSTSSASSRLRRRRSAARTAIDGHRRDDDRGDASARAQAAATSAA